MSREIWGSAPNPGKGMMPLQPRMGLATGMRSLLRPLFLLSIKQKKHNGSKEGTSLADGF